MGRTFIVVSARTVLALMFGIGRGWLVGSIACDDGAQGVVYEYSMGEGVMCGLGLMVYDGMVGRGLSAPQISSSVPIIHRYLTAWRRARGPPHEFFNGQVPGLY